MNHPHKEQPNKFILKLVCPIVRVQWANGCDKDKILIFSLFLKLENQNSKYSNADCKYQLEGKHLLKVSDRNLKKNGKSD